METLAEIVAELAVRFEALLTVATGAGYTLIVWELLVAVPAVLVTWHAIVNVPLEPEERVGVSVMEAVLRMLAVADAVPLVIVQAIVPDWAGTLAVKATPVVTAEDALTVAFGGGATLMVAVPVPGSPAALVTRQVSVTEDPLFALKVTDGLVPPAAMVPFDEIDHR